MPSKVYTAALTGLNCTIVEVEVESRRGNPYFAIVGLADKSIQEAKDRIPPAVRSSGAEYIPGRVIANLAPAEIYKSGPSYDFPITVGYLVAENQVDFDPEKKLFIGELALDGRLRPVSGILPIADAAQKMGYEEIYLPYENAGEAALVDDIKVFGVRTLREIIDHFHGYKEIQPFEGDKSAYEGSHDAVFDMAQVKGQEHAKRALAIAAAGGHNLLMSGVPGSGKTMLSRCLPGILPEMSVDESLEVTRIYSISGLTSKEQPLVTTRPFRTPHHTSSQVALVGGGTIPKPGEISLAHRGVLFLDEFPEFSSQSLEALRQPMEDNVVTISRASGSLTFPANFILVAAMNPCPCGYLGDPVKECSCSQHQIARYRKKISGPILDRIDLLINVAKVDNKKLFSQEEGESSESVRERVQNARNHQLDRFEEAGIYSNSEMSQKAIKQFVKLDSETKKILNMAVEKMNLSARSYFRLLKVSRTIADLEGSEDVKQDHVTEALSYRVEIG